MTNIRPIFFLLLLCFPALLFSDSDIRSVKAEFNRCESTMERVSREVLRFEQAVQRCKRLTNQKLEGAHVFTDDLLKLENRVDYFRSRIDRTFGQRDKIRNDLNNIKGATCPSCITSSIDMYCRNSENLTNEVENYISQVALLEDRIHNTSGSASSQKKRSFSERRQEIGKAVTSRKAQLDSCESAAGQQLWKQCAINLHRADSLNNAGNAEQSVKTLTLVELLLKKAIDKCSGL